MGGLEGLGDSDCGSFLRRPLKSGQAVRPAWLIGEGWASGGVAGDALEWGCR